MRRESRYYRTWSFDWRSRRGQPIHPSMSSISSIASLATAQSAAELQMAAATKVLKISQDQNQVVADLLTGMLEDVEELVSGVAGEVGTTIDVSA